MEVVVELERVDLGFAQAGTKPGKVCVSNALLKQQCGKRTTYVVAETVIDGVPLYATAYRSEKSAREAFNRLWRPTP